MFFGSYRALKLYIHHFLLLDQAGASELVKEPLGVQGRRVDAHTGCVEHRVADRRGDRDRRRLTERLVPVRTGRVDGLDEVPVEVRRVDGGHQLVVEQVVVEHPPGLGIELVVFVERVAEAHAHPSVHLPHRGLMVEDPS